MTIWQTIRGWATQESKNFIYQRIAAHRTKDPTGVPIAANAGYVRVKLANMFLAKNRDWFIDWHPCVSTQVTLQLDGKKGQSITHVAAPPQNAMGAGVRVGYPVTDLLPFSGDLVEIQAALIALRGKDYVGAALGMLSSFSSLVPGPINQAVTIAQQIDKGLDQLFGSVNGDEVHLGFHDSFGSDGSNSTLQSGYLAVILATTNQIDPSKLGVADQILYLENAPGQWQPLVGFDYMLYYIEGRVERDDYRLPSIQEPLDKAIAAAVLGESADAHKKAALVAALTCKELTPLDRRRVAAAIKAEIEAAAGQGQGAIGAGATDLAEVVKVRAAAHAQALAGDVPTGEEILA